MWLFDWNDSNKQRLKWLGIGAMAFGIGFFVHRAIKNNKKSKDIHQNHKGNNKVERLNTQKSEYSDYYFDKSLELRFIEESLPNIPTVEQIYTASPILAREEFIKYTKEIRKRRRLVRKTNEDQYIELILQYHKEVEDLLVRSRVELLEYLNIELGDFNRMQESFQQFEDLKNLHKETEHNLYSKLITFCPVKKMSDGVLQQIMDEEIGFIKNKMYNRIRNKMQKDLLLSQDQILLIVETLLQDIIYQKFGYEKEDIFRKIDEACGVSTLERELAFKKMAADISDFSFESIESSGDEEHTPQNNLKNSHPTVGKSSESDDQGE